MYPNIIKVSIDFVIGLFVIIVFSPLMLLFMISLAITNKGNPFFIQLRPGKKGKTFKIIKFKTMNDKKDAEGNLLPDEQRLTKIGQFVRKTSMDELPQILNVLKGDMSFIGPRPLLIEYLDIYTEEQNKRHLVKPGMTGWAQINGRNAITWCEKFELDVYYVDNVSFRLDVEIFFKSFRKVVESQGISAKNHVTTEKFNGKN